MCGTPFEVWVIRRSAGRGGASRCTRERRRVRAARSIELASVVVRDGCRLQGSGWLGRVRLRLEELEEPIAKLLIPGVRQELDALAGSLEGHVEDASDGRRGAARHHHDAIREKERLVDVVRDHDRCLVTRAARALLEDADE